MDSPWLPAAQEIQTVVAEEVTAAGGTMQDCCINQFDDLFLRFVLPRVAEVLRRDTVEGGVAVKAVAAEVLVSPYTFRRVCRNGAIWAQPIQAQCLGRAEFTASDAAIAEVTSKVRDAVRASCEPEVFSTAVGRMRSSTKERADVMLHLFPALSQMVRSFLARPLSRVLRRFESGGDTSVFGLMNAVTSVARDEPDPETRWRLEELGGAILERLPSAPKPGGLSAALVLV